MHPNDNLLRALSDHELPAVQAGQVQEHLARCEPCLKKYQVIQARAGRINQQIHILSPKLKPDHTQQAYFHFIRSTNQRKDTNTPMKNRKPLWTALAVVAILAIALSLTPVRAWASDFLSLFRVQRITVIQFDPEKAESLNESMSVNQQAIEKILNDQLVVTEQGDKQPVVSVEEAAAAAGFTPRIPQAFSGANLFVQPGVNASLTIDQPAMQALLDMMEAQVTLPPETDGQEVNVTVAPAVIASFGCQTGDPDELSRCTEFYQMPSPEISAPDGLDIQGLGSAMLQMLGMSPEEARQMSQSIDWTSTLVLPVPQDENIQVSEMPVDGVTGTFLQSPSENLYMLMWVKDGYIYALHAPSSTDAQALLSDLQ
jgi:hypothetical protein